MKKDILLLGGIMKNAQEILDNEDPIYMVTKNPLSSLALTILEPISMTITSILLISLMIMSRNSFVVVITVHILTSIYRKKLVDIKWFEKQYRLM